MYNLSWDVTYVKFHENVKFELRRPADDPLYFKPAKLETSARGMNTSSLTSQHHIGLSQNHVFGHWSWWSRRIPFFIAFRVCVASFASLSFVTQGKLKAKRNLSVSVSEFQFKHHWPWSWSVWIISQRRWESTENTGFWFHLWGIKHTKKHISELSNLIECKWSQVP